MAGKSTKGCNTFQTTLKPSCSCSSLELGDDGPPEKVASTTAAAALTSEDFRGELVTLLRNDIGEIMETELRMAIEGEMAFIRADLSAVAAELKSYQDNISKKLTTLGGTVCEMERSLSSCTDDVTTLQREVQCLTTLTESLQNKCDDLELRFRRNNIRIIGVPEGKDSCTTTAMSVLLRKAFNLADAPLLDRAHRSLQPAPKQGGTPCTSSWPVCTTTTNVPTFYAVPERNSGFEWMMTISVYPDYTTQVARARAT
ncbi:hypothetical protein LDENG_00210340 [Lucifuga dentata]|nr:hypothetical protein LDENG_00210340 [Lucifuga dentata]